LLLIILVLWMSRTGGALPAPPVLGAAAGALLASPARSLLPVLIGGAIGYAAGLFF
jgi:hypothetical protein